MRQKKSLEEFDTDIILMKRERATVNKIPKELVWIDGRVVTKRNGK